MGTGREQTPTLTAYEQSLLTLLPPPPPSSSTPPTPPTIPSLLAHIKQLVSTHDEHVSRCRSTMASVRQTGENPPPPEDGDDEEGGGEEDEGWDWRLRVDVDDEEDDPGAAVLPRENADLKKAVRYMMDGTGY